MEFFTKIFLFKKTLDDLKADEIIKKNELPDSIDKKNEINFLYFMDPLQFSSNNNENGLPERELKRRYYGLILMLGYLPRHKFLDLNAEANLTTVVEARKIGEDYNKKKEHIQLLKLLELQLQAEKTKIEKLKNFSIKQGMTEEHIMALLN